MKTFCILFAAALLLGGCATDPGDKAFFEKGWWRPGDNDARMKQYRG